jgi:hypothetical protein
MALFADVAVADIQPDPTGALEPTAGHVIVNVPEEEELEEGVRRDDTRLLDLYRKAARSNPTFKHSAVLVGFENAAVEDAYTASLAENRLPIPKPKTQRIFHAPPHPTLLGGRSGVSCLLGAQL